MLLSSVTINEDGQVQTKARLKGCVGRSQLAECVQRRRQATAGEKHPTS
jgi:hypothetical protein